MPVGEIYFDKRKQKPKINIKCLIFKAAPNSGIQTDDTLDTIIRKLDARLNAVEKRIKQLE